ncbi:hypothetical protein [Edaphobacter sp.]|uniref:hypothetical protein n=1 Tax=Edaphobacter sp. TaxID=1934404 RepID=UPI002DBAEA47|nr:hypothetical protein [Edaphobacter sp.]HEU5341035.1 hypothetical protein [Edaphobacter sp.]
MTWFRIKVVLINLGIAAALVYRYWTGTPLHLILIIGAIIFIVANGLMIIAQEQSAQNAKRRSR